MFIIIREHEWKQKVDYFFYRDFWWRHIFLISLYNEQVRMHVHEKNWTSLQVHKEKVHNVRVSQFHKFHRFFMCVLREKWEQRRTKFHRWCLSGKKSRKAKAHTPFSSIFAQMQCQSMETNDGCSFCVVTLSQCWLQRY